MKIFSALILLAATSGATIQAADTPWPKAVAKDLYSTHDYRGEKMPLLRIDKWMNSDEPDLKGKVVIVDYWATWCQPCYDKIAELNRIAKKYEGKVVVIGISDEDEETVAWFLKKKRMDYNVAINGTARIGHLMGFSAIPYVLVISPDWVVRWQGVPGDEKDEFTDKVIDQVLAASRVK